MFLCLTGVGFCANVLILSCNSWVSCFTCVTPISAQFCALSVSLSQTIAPGAPLMVTKHHRVYQIATCARSPIVSLNSVVKIRRWNWKLCNLERCGETDQSFWTTRHPVPKIEEELDMIETNCKFWIENWDSGLGGLHSNCNEVFNFWIFDRVPSK